MDNLKTRAGFDRYDDLIDQPNADGELRALPTDGAVAHLVIVDEDTRISCGRTIAAPLHPKLPTFVDSWSSEISACGKRIRSVAPIPFDPSDPDACQRCADQLAYWHADAEGWSVAQKAMLVERERRRAEREDLAEFGSTRSAGYGGSPKRRNAPPL